MSFSSSKALKIPIQDFHNFYMTLTAISSRPLCTYYHSAAHYYPVWSVTGCLFRQWANCFFPPLCRAEHGSEWFWWRKDCQNTSRLHWGTSKLPGLNGMLIYTQFPAQHSYIRFYESKCIYKRLQVNLDRHTLELLCFFFFTSSQLNIYVYI